MSEASKRSVVVERTSTGQFIATNPRGGTVRFGTDGGEAFTPSNCCSPPSGLLGGRRRRRHGPHAEPTRFTVEVSGDKISDEQGNRMTDLRVTFHIAFPDGEGADRARAILPRAVKASHDRLCTVSRTVELGTPVTTEIAED